MNIGLSTSVIQRGRSGVAQYVFALVEALTRQAAQHDLTLFVLEDDVPLFDFAKESATIVPVSERFRAPVKDILLEAWQADAAGIHAHPEPSITTPSTRMRSPAAFGPAMSQPSSRL